MALEQRFRIINDRVSLVDIPGIDDGILATQITAYIEKKAEKLVPIILIHLTAGGFTEIKHFKDLVPQFKYIRVFPTIIFTKFDHLINDIKARIKAEEEEEEDEEKKLKPAEKERKVVARVTEVISDYMNRVLEELPHSQFFIFNPNSKVYGYKFEYGP